MIRSNWLKSLRQRIAKSGVRRTRLTQHSARRRSNDLCRVAEYLEDRTLLTVTSSFNATFGVLTVSSDAADNIVITASGSNVKINGADPDTGTLSAGAISQITVMASGNFSNQIDLTGVTAAAGFSGSLSNLIEAGEGNDTISGSEFRDTVNGGDGDDQLTGGAGSDQYEFYVFGSSSQNDVIDESGGGTDVVCIFTETGGATLDLSNAAAQTVVSGTPSLTLTLGSATAIENACANFGGNTLTGNTLDNQLNGGGTLNGGDGNDMLLGLDGSNDSLVGGNGNDVYQVLGGGSLGTDVFDESSGSGSDTVDFTFYDNGNNSGITVDLDGTAAQSYGSGGSSFQFKGTIENAIGSIFNDTFSVDPLANVTRIIGGADPTSGSPGDTLNVDLMNNSFTHTPGATGSGTIDVTLVGGTGTIGYSSIETLNLLNPGSSAVATTTTVSASPASPGSFGQSITFTATVSPNSGGNVPTGSVTFTVDGTPGGPVTLNVAGEASFSASQLSVGQHTIVAKYSSNSANFNNSTSTNFNYDIVAVPLVHSGTSGSDNLILRLNSAGNTIEIVNADTNAILASALKAGTLNVVINTLDGNDSLTIDEANGLIDVPGGVQFDGGAGDDQLKVVGNVVVETRYDVGPENSSGRLEHRIGAVVQNVVFHNLEPLIDLVPGTLTVNGTAAANSINVNAGPNSGMAAVGSATSGQVQVDSFESIEFANKTNLTINGLAGADTIGVSTFSTGFSGTLTTNGGDPAEGDKLVITGTSGDDSFQYDPSSSAIDAGRIALAGRNLDFTGIEDVLISGGAGAADTLVVNGLAGDDTVLVRPLGQQEAVLRVNSSTSLRVAQLENITIDTGANSVGGLDRIVVEGTSSDDNVTLKSGEVTVNQQKFVLLQHEQIDVHLGDGNDALTVNPSTTVGMNVYGGGPSAGDVLNLVGSGEANVALTLPHPINGVAGLQEIGGRPVFASGFEQINVDAGNQSVAIAGTQFDDEISYTPLKASGLDFAAVSRAGVNTQFLLANAASITLDPVGGLDTVIVNGNVADNTIDVVEGATDLDVTIVGLKSLKLVAANTEFLEVNGHAGNDAFNVTPGTTPISIDGGDPIGPGAAQDVINLLPSGTSFSFGNYQPGPESDEGSLVVGGTPVSFDHIEAFTVSLAGFEEVEMQGSTANDVMRLSAPTSTSIAVGGAGSLPLVLNGIPDDVTFNVLGGDGDDNLVLDFSAGDFGIPIHYRGGANATTDPGDVLTLVGDRELESGTFTHFDANSGQIDFSNNATITYAEIEPIQIGIPQLGGVTVLFSDQSETITIQTVDVPMLGGGLLRRDTLIETSHGEKLRFEALNSDLKLITSGANSGTDQVRVFNKIDARVFEIDGDNSDSIIVDTSQIFAESRFKAGRIDINASAGGTLEATTVTLSAGFSSGKITAGEVVIDAPEVRIDNSDLTGVGIIRADSAGRSLTVRDPDGIVPLMNAAPFLHNVSIDAKFGQFSPNRILFAVVNKDIRVAANGTTPGSIKLEGNIQLTGDTVFDTSGSATVDGGKVDLLNATIFADAAGRVLSINTHGKSGGDVLTGTFAVPKDSQGRLFPGTLVDDLRINPSSSLPAGTVRGSVEIERPVNLRDDLNILGSAGTAIDINAPITASYVRIGVGVGDATPFDNVTITIDAGIDAPFVAVTALSQIDVNGKLEGGFITRLTAPTVVLGADIQTDGGSANIEADVLRLTNNVTIDTESDQTGNAGDVVLSPLNSPSNQIVTADQPGRDLTIDASTPDPSGRGGLINLLADFRGAAPYVMLNDVRLDARGGTTGQVRIDQIDVAGVANDPASVRIAGNLRVLGSTKINAPGGLIDLSQALIGGFGLGADLELRAVGTNGANGGEVQLPNLVALGLSIEHGQTFPPLQDLLRSLVVDVTAAPGGQPGKIVARDIILKNANVSAPASLKLAGNVSLPATATFRTDSNTSNGGTIDLSDATFSAGAANVSLMLDSTYFGGATGFNGGRILLGGFSDNGGRDLKVRGLLTDSRSLAPSGGNGGSVTTHGSIDILGRLAVSSNAGSDVHINHPISTLDEIEIDLPDRVLAYANLAAATGIHLKANALVDVFAQLDDTRGTGNVSLVAPTIQLRGDILTGGGDVTFDGDVVVRANTVDIVTLTATANVVPGTAPGDVIFLGPSLSADSKGRSLSIDTSSTSGNAGNVNLPFTTAFGGEFLKGLNVRASGGTADGLIDLDLGLFLEGNGSNDPARLILAGDVRLDGNTVISTGDRSISGGSMNLKDANFSATVTGANLTLDSRATGGSGNGGNIDLGTFNTPSGTFDLNDLTIRATGPTTNGTMFVNHDISIDGDLTLSGDVQLQQAATILSTSDNVGSAGHIELRGANVLPSQTLSTSDLALFARHAGGVANQNGGNVLLGMVSGLNNLSITNTTNGAGGRGGSVMVTGPLSVGGQLHITSSAGDTQNPSRVTFDNTVAVGAGGLLIDPPDEVLFARRVTSAGPVDVQANQLIEVRDVIDATTFTAAGSLGIRLHALQPTATVKVRSGLFTDGKEVRLIGDVAIAGTVRIDTESDNSGDAGDVQLLSNSGVQDRIYATSLSSDLIIDASSPATGGDVTIGSPFTGGPTAGMVNGTLPLNDLTIDSSGGTATGLIQLGQPIQLTSGGPTSPSTLTIAGAVALTANVALNVSDALASGGTVDLRRATISSLGATPFDLIIDTRHTGSHPGKSGGDVLLGQFVHPLLDAPVASLRIDATTNSPSGGAGGSVTTGGAATLGNQLKITTSPGSGSATSSVNLNHDITINGAGGLSIGPPDTVTLQPGTALRSRGPVLITAARTIDLDGLVNAAHAGANGNNVNLTAPLVRLSNTITTDEGPSGLSRGGGIVIDGNVLIDGNVTLRTEANNSGNAGNIEFLGGTVGADVPGRDLNLLAFTLDAAGRGGEIRLTQFSKVAQTNGALLNDVIVANTGGTPGTITLPRDITLGGDGAADPSSLTFGGNVLVTNDVTLSTADAINDGGAIDFSLATIGADQIGRGLIVDSRYRGADGTRSGGAVTLGTMQNFRGTFGADLTDATIRSISDAGGASGPVTLGGIVSLLGDLHVAGGPIAVNSAVVGTNGDQTYDFPVTLGAAGSSVAFVARDVLFASTVDNGGKELQLLVSGNSGVAQQPISGAGGLRKLGAGTFTLAATNTFAGTTSINAGRLNVNGSLASASVGIAGGTLGGTGQISGPVGMGPAGGGVSPGTSPGTLTVDNHVTFFTGTSFDVELGASQRDQLKVTGNGSLVTLDNATLNLSLLASTPQAGETLTIIDNGGSSAVVGTFLNLNEGATTAVGTFNAQISYVGGDGNDVVLTVLAPTPVATINTTGGVISFGSLASSGGSSGSGGGLTLGPITVARSVDGRALNVSIPRAFLQLDDGSLNTTGTINIPVDGLENVVLAGAAGVTSLVLDLQQMSGNLRLTSGDGDEVPFDAVGLSGFLAGATLVASGFADIRVLGDGDDNLTVSAPRIPDPTSEAGILIGLLRVAGGGLGDGTDSILIGLLRTDVGSQGNAATRIGFSGLNDVNVESSGNTTVEFHTATLAGAAAYHATLQDTDVGVIAGGSGISNPIVAARVGDAWRVTNNGATNPRPIHLTGGGRYEVRGGDRDDSLTINETGGLITNPGGIFFDGGLGFDTLQFNGAKPVASSYQVGPGITEGMVSHANATGMQRVGFTGLEPVLDLVPGTVMIDATNADNAINIAVGPNSTANAPTGIITVDGFESYEFGLKTTVTINGLAGQDVFGVSNLSSGFSGLLVLQGGAPADGDQLILNGSASDDVFGYLPHPELPDAGAFTGLGGGLLFFGIEDVTVAGGLGNDSLTALGGVGTTTRSFTTPATGGSDSKIFAAAFATNSTSGTDTSLRAFGGDGLTPIGGAVNDNSGPLNAALIAGAPLPANELNVTFVVGSGDGQNISEFDFVGGLIAPSEFTTEDEPNNNSTGTVNPIAVNIDQSDRIAQLGQVAPLSGDIDLIAVNINQSDRTASPIVGGEISVNINQSDLIVGGGQIALTLANGGFLLLNVDDTGLILGGTIAVNIDQSDRVIGQVTGGQISVNVDQSDRVLGGEISVTIDQSGRVLNGEIAVTIDQSGRVLGGEVAVTIDQSGRIAAIINNDPNGNGEFTQTSLRILGSDGETPIAFGSNLASAASNAIITGPLATGTYYIEITNGATSGESDYEIVVFGVFNSQAQHAEPRNSSPFSGLVITPPQHGAGSIGSNVRNDSVELTPRGNKESRLRYNNSSPLELIDFENVTVDPRDGIDTLNVFGTPNSDSFEFTGTTVTLNNQAFGHVNTEVFNALANSGDDTIAIRSSLGRPVGVDGGDGRDRVTFDGSGSTVVVALPNVLAEGVSRIVNTLAVEDFSVNSGAAGIVIAGAPDAVSGVSVTPTGTNTAHVTGGGFRYDLTGSSVTISGTAPAAGSQVALQQVDVHASVLDDTITVSDTEVNIGGGRLPIGLLGIPSVDVFGGKGSDTFNVTPSASTNFFIDGGDPIGFGDRLNIVVASGTNHTGPQTDEGAWEISNARPISYDRIERSQLTPPATTLVQTDAYSLSALFIELEAPSGAIHRLALQGTSERKLVFESTMVGAANDDDTDGLDDIVRELSRLNVSGVSPLGSTQVSLNPASRSAGLIEETSNSNPGMLDTAPHGSGEPPMTRLHCF